VLLGETPIVISAQARLNEGHFQHEEEEQSSVESTELLKFGAVVFLYGLVAPALGLLLKLRPQWQRWCFALLCFMTTGGIFEAADWAFTLSFFEYRGHAKGYHFYFADVVALALVIGVALEDWKRVKILPPGLWLYFAYCAVSIVSVVNAPEPRLVFMAAFKFVKMAVVFVAAFNFLRNQANVRFFLTAMAATIGWQLIVVIRMKYWQGFYQVPGTFEHQNSLSMFTTMIGLVFLAAALGPRESLTKIYLGAFLACAFIQQSTLSRAGLAIFAGGTATVVILSFIDRLTKERLAVLGVLVVTGAIGLIMTMDTIIGRFEDRSNEASGKTRELLNIASRNMLEDHPLGIGWNNFGVAINRPLPYGDVIDRWEREGGVRIDPTHKKGIAESHYYLLLAETGYQGLFFYVVLISVFLWRGIRAAIYFRHQFLGSVSLGIVAGCAFNYIHSFFERVLTQPRNLMLWMLLLGAVARIDCWRRWHRAGQLRTAAVDEEESLASASR
jgi:hypothetical protein